MLVVSRLHALGFADRRCAYVAAKRMARSSARDAGTGEPVGDQFDRGALARAVEMIAVGHERELRWAAGALDKGLAGINMLRLAIAAQEQHRPAPLPRQLQNGGADREVIDKSLRAEY